MKYKTYPLYIITGGPGAGKTTLLNELESIGYRTVPEEGRRIIKEQILVNGEGLPWMNKKLFGELMFEASVRSYQEVMGTGSSGPYFTAGKEADITEIIKKFNLPLKKYVQYYSSGMKKKLALIGMLMLDKPINILDEPFNGVDFEGVHILYDIIRQLKSENKIVIVSSHIIETLFHTCDKIAVLQNGKIEKIYDKEDFGQLATLKF